MKLKEAQAKIKTICNIPFADIFEELDFPMIIRNKVRNNYYCLLYTSPSPRDA